MKIKLFILFFAIFALLKTTSSQQVFASTIKIGPFSLDMKNAEVDKICGRKISKVELKNSAENFEKMVEVVVDDINYKLRFYEDYNDKGEPNGNYKLTSIKCVSGNIKTKSGITVGMNKYDVLKKLDEMNISFHFYKNKEYDNEGKPKNKFYEMIEIIDSDAYRTLTLEITNDKISGFVLSYQEDGC